MQIKTTLRFHLTQIRMAKIKISKDSTCYLSQGLYSIPRVENVIYDLRNRRCIEGCDYCNNAINPLKALNKYFNYKEFRSYEGEPLQERAVSVAIDGKSLLAIFPTGGGKSLTFQLPALVQGEAVRGLTVVISPLQSLMKDQVDNLDQKGITAP